MEAIEEPPLQDDTVETVKANVNCEESAGVEATVPSDVCHRPNGIADSKNSEQVLQPFVDDNGISDVEHPSNKTIEDNTENVDTELQPAMAVEVAIDEPITSTSDEVTKDVLLEEIVKSDDVEVKVDNNEVMQAEDEAVEVDGIVETMSESVRFETEILIETNVEDQTTKYKIIYDEVDEPDHSNNILNELGQNIELSEVLRSSDVTENVENNNCEVRQEVFNKEELLDILEGNDMEESRNVISENFTSDCKKLETELALQQLSRLKHAGRKPRNTPKKSEKKTPKRGDSPKEVVKKSDSPKGKKSDSLKEAAKKSDLPKEEGIKKKSDSPKESVKRKIDLPKEEGSTKRNDLPKESDKINSGLPMKEAVMESSDLTNEGVINNNDLPKGAKKKSSKQRGDNSQANNIITDSTVEPKEESIVNALVKDWEDDEPAEGDQAKKLIEHTENLIGAAEELEMSQETTVEESNTSHADTPMVDEQTPNLNKSDSDTQPQRRLGRVIKKKVIFDPDNPDTFTKTKVVIKKENQTDKDQKDQPAPKKIKTDPTSVRSKSKSPIQSKLQWKKPQPKNLKQNKRLTEIDRLLMDEGAVNMICQLTPEAPKGHKNMKSKAEFIKKIQSSTPEGKEMKFRERKKELRSEDGDAKRIGFGKDRLSLSSSVKSPAISEDFEAHSADDSIIYRRHSSSSYSSPCMSPRRLSDVESVNQNVQASTQNAAALISRIKTHQDSHSISSGSDVFMSETAGSLATGVINKSDFLSIKEKLNSKLSQALNKRKRDSNKPEKPSKIKKVYKLTEKPAVVGNYKYVRLITGEKLAEICIQQAGNIYNIEVMNELKSVLETVESNNDVSVTLLTAEFGSLCSGIELKPLLDQEKALSYAQELSECARSLLSTLECHSKLVCTVVEDKCHGLGLSLVALSDITVASERVTFELSALKGEPLQPGAAVLSACGLPQSLLNEIIVLERPILAAEALRCGLVSRTVWPERVLDQGRAIAKDIAAQPTENLILKKQLLRLKRGGSESILASLEKERDLFVKYWTSPEGRELVRASLENTKE